MSAVEEVPRGLVYNPELSFVLACSSSCTTDASQQHCDQDAKRIISALKEAKVIGDSRSTLLTTASETFTKKGLQDAILSHASTVTPDEYGLFIFVYCGRALVSKSESDTKSHALVLTGSDYEDKESFLSGQEIAATIASSPVKPKQILVILDCPYAAEIGEDFNKHLQKPCELNLIVSQQKNEKPYYFSPLKSSTFTHFFCHFLSTQEFTGHGPGNLRGLFMRCLFKKVQNCCHALSGLVHEKSIPTCKAAAPEAHITQSAEEVKVAKEETDGSSFGKPLKKPHLCEEVEKWVRNVEQGPLQELQEEGVLEGQVLSAVVTAMVFSMAAIQTAPQGNSSRYSKSFLQAYIDNAAAAVEMVSQKMIDEKELNELKTTIEKYNVFV